MKRTLKEERKRRVMFYDIWFWSPFIILFLVFGVENETIGAIGMLGVLVLPFLMCFRLLYFAIKRKDWVWVVLLFLGGFFYSIYYLFVIRKAIREGKEKTKGHTKELKQREKKETEKKRKKYHENIRRRAI